MWTSVVIRFTACSVLGHLYLPTVLAKHPPKPKKVRKACEKIFETAFPPQQWSNAKDLKAFTKLIATDQPNYFACPEGGSNNLKNYAGSDLMKWFLTNFNPDDFKYTEYIWGDIMVAGSVCSFDKLFFAEIGNDCQIQAQSRLIMEIDPKHHTLVKWVDHVDADELSAKFDKCLATAAPSVAPTESPTPRPTHHPTDMPTVSPSKAPTLAPTSPPTSAPTKAPTSAPTPEPTPGPSASTIVPTDMKTRAPLLATKTAAAEDDTPIAINRETTEDLITVDTVRQRCVEIFETAFPPQQWVSAKDLKAFSNMFAVDKHNYFACPEGGPSALSNFTSDELLEWFATNFDPKAFKYAEYIIGDVSVAGNVCSFDKVFFAEIGDDCHFSAKSLLFMELKDDGKLLKWFDHFDEEEVNEKFSTCLKKQKKKKGSRVEMEGLRQFAEQAYGTSRGGSLFQPQVPTGLTAFVAAAAIVYLTVVWYRRKHPPILMVPSPRSPLSDITTPTINYGSGL